MSDSCSVDDCEAPVIARGWCFKHYARWRANGTTETVKMRPASVRLMERYRETPTGCWEFTGGRSGSGYGVISQAGKSLLAHRVSYELHKGPIPDGMVVMHSCDNPPCINPAHLSTGTAGDNNRDRSRKGRSRGRYSK